MMGMLHKQSSLRWSTLPGETHFVCPLLWIHRVCVFTLLLSACCPTRDHYISPESFGSNIATILAAGKDAGVTRFLLITPPPVCEACRRAKAPVSHPLLSPSFLFQQQI